MIAEIPGEDPVLRNEVVLVGAHLDSLPAATGATDNADGAVAGRRSDAHPESGRRASAPDDSRGDLERRRSRASSAARPTCSSISRDAASRDKMAVYLNNDPGSRRDLRLVHGEQRRRARAIFDAWLEPLKDLGLKRNVMDSNFTSEDGVFDGVGIPAFTTIMDYTNYDARTRHTNADFFEAVSEKDLQQSAIVMAVFAYQAAMRDRADSAAPGRRACQPSPGGGTRCRSRRRRRTPAIDATLLYSKYAGTSRFVSRRISIMARRSLSARRRYRGSFSCPDSTRHIRW